MEDSNHDNEDSLGDGGYGALGEAISTRLQEADCEVVVTHSPRNAGVASWLSRMRESGHRFHAFPVDVADYDSCQQCVARIRAEIGPVDILINNAGITRDTSFRKMEKADRNAVMRTNLDSVFNMNKPMCDAMVKRGWGRIVNVSSIIGSKGGFGQTNYAAAKAGMHGFTKSLALEVAKSGVTLNTVSPGFIASGSISLLCGETARPQPRWDPRNPSLAKSRGLPEPAAGPKNQAVAFPSSPSQVRPRIDLADHRARPDGPCVS